jgi:hypothetical protein
VCSKLTVLLLLLLTGALIVNFVQKYILRIKDPNIEDLWLELDEQEWYQTLVRNEKVNNFIRYSKENGLLSDPFYVRKILDKEGHREGFIRHVSEKVNK